MKNLNEMLDEVSVIPPGDWENDVSRVLGDWFAVADETGIIAYFGNETDALRFRLDLINRRLNP